MKTYSAGSTPEKIIAKELNKLPNGYYISAPSSSEDFKTIAAIVNQGIDSHLEAITESKFDTTPAHPKLKGFGTRLECYFSTKDMLVFLRRLFEDGSDAAWLLRTDILYTLNIEEV